MVLVFPVLMLFQNTLKATIYRDGSVWEQEYQRGKPKYKVKEVGKTERKRY